MGTQSRDARRPPDLAVGHAELADLTYADIPRPSRDSVVGASRRPASQLYAYAIRNTRS